MLVSIFRSRLLEENSAEFQALADRMMTIAEAMPGFLSYKVFVAEDGERCSIVEFESAEALAAWRNHPEHREAQELGRQRYYLEYSLQVGEPARETRFSRPASAG